MSEQRVEELNLNDEITVLVRRGRDDSKIGRLSDGRVLLFTTDTPFNVEVGDTVVGEIVHITTKYLLVKPLRVMGDNFEAMIENLKNVEASGHYQHAVLAKGLLWLIGEQKKRYPEE